MKHTLYLSLVIIILFSGCEGAYPKDKCVNGHYETVIMPATIIDSKGGVSVAYIPQQIYVCDSSAKTIIKNSASGVDSIELYSDTVIIWQDGKKQTK